MAMVGENKRSTIEMDVTTKRFPVNLKSIEAALKTILAVDVGDGVYMEVSKIEQTRADDEYDGFRILNVKPILVLDEHGSVEVFNKVRSTKRVYKQWIELVEEAHEKYKGKIDVAFAHGDVEEDILEAKEQVQELFPNLDYRVGFLTPILGTHGGKGAKGMGIIPIVD